MPLSGILILTHSRRATDLSLCSREYFQKRYSDPDRLNKLPPFERLAPVKTFQVYNGSVSFFHVTIGEKGSRVQLRCLGTIKKREKIQHVAMIDAERVLVCYEDGLETWTLSTPLNRKRRVTSATFELERRVDHPHFAGLHTVFTLDAHRAIVSASAPDAVFIVDLATGTIEKTLRMPRDLYGFNYALKPDMDLREHYIHNDCQTTHVNCAYPMSKNRILVSTLIQGAIGWFELDSGRYHELSRGFVGCHGARVNEAGEIYFADSSTGTLITLDNDGRVAREFQVKSGWLHDVQQVSGDIYAFSMADGNEFRIYDVGTGSLLARKSFFSSSTRNVRLQNYVEKLPFWFGNSTQFLSFLQL